MRRMEELPVQDVLFSLSHAVVIVVAQTSKGGRFMTNFAYSTSIVTVGRYTGLGSTERTSISFPDQDDTDLKKPSGR